ncbi:MAG: PadR family transcriptional regulator [Promethearchaeati archaeon SRVP18_Atabeyarchaeia-1]
MSSRVPHTVPRGLLRFYILSLLTKKPMKGYEIIRDIEDRTSGVWKPGPGSIYPMLESMKKEGMVQASPSPKGGMRPRRGTSLQITEKGKGELSRFRENLKHGMPARARSLYLVFADIAYPGLEFDEVMLAERKREVERLQTVFGDEYWGTVSAEKKRRFIERYAKILQEELELVKTKLGSAHEDNGKA